MAQTNITAPVLNSHNQTSSISSETKYSYDYINSQCTKSNESPILEDSQSSRKNSILDLNIPLMKENYQAYPLHYSPQYSTSYPNRVPSLASICSAETFIHSPRTNSIQSNSGSLFPLKEQTVKEHTVGDEEQDYQVPLIKPTDPIRGRPTTIKKMDNLKGKKFIKSTRTSPPKISSDNFQYLQRRKQSMPNPSLYHQSNVSPTYHYQQPFYQNASQNPYQHMQQQTLMSPEQHEHHLMPLGMAQRSFMMRRISTPGPIPLSRSSHLLHRGSLPNSAYSPYPQQFLHPSQGLHRGSHSDGLTNFHMSNQEEDRELTSDDETKAIHRVNEQRRRNKMKSAISELSLNLDRLEELKGNRPTKKSKMEIFKLASYHIQQYTDMLQAGSNASN